jgi:hypothetical protein
VSVDAADGLLETVVVVNPFADSLVPLNVCRPVPGWSVEVQAYETALAFSRLFDVSLGLHMENILRHLLILLSEAGLSLVEAPAILRDDVLRGILANRSGHAAVKDFFLGTYEGIPQVSKDALLNRLQGLLLAENLRLMLGADEFVDFGGILDRGASLLVFLGKGPGVPEEQVDVVGSLFLQFLFQATYARRPGRRTPYLLAIDEFFHLLEAPALARRFATALTTCRSFGLSLMLIHHNFAQLPPALREAVLVNCDAVALFRTSSRNAEFVGDFLPTVDPETVSRSWARGERHRTPGEIRRHQLELLQRLPNRHCYWYDRRRPYRAVRLRVPDVPPPRLTHDVSPALLEQFGSGQLRGATVSRSELRQQIEKRAQRLRELARPPLAISRVVETASTPRLPRRGGGKPSLG